MYLCAHVYYCTGMIFWCARSLRTFPSNRHKIIVERSSVITSASRFPPGTTHRYVLHPDEVENARACANVCYLALVLANEDKQRARVQLSFRRYAFRSLVRIRKKTKDGKRRRHRGRMLRHRKTR
jgi:hypothetical protein